MHRALRFLIPAVLVLLSCPARSAAAGRSEGEVNEYDEPGFHWIERRDYYDVRGHTLAQLRQELQRSPLLDGDQGRATGLTLQGFTTRYQTQAAAEGCRLTEVHVELDLTIHLPRRATPASLEYATQRAWDAMSAAVLLHEEGHRDNALRAGRDLTRRLTDLAPMPCSRLRSAAQRVIDDVMLRLSIREEMYDRGTQHGVRQGVIL